MRKWSPVALIGLAVVWFILTNVGASVALNDFTARPIVALNRDTIRVPVQVSGRPPAAGEARGLGGQGVMFGFAIQYALPDGTHVSCTQRFRRLTCDGGWTPERAS
jgi:hypothetical protein